MGQLKKEAGLKCNKRKDVMNLNNKNKNKHVKSVSYVSIQNSFLNLPAR